MRNFADKTARQSSVFAYTPTYTLTYCTQKRNFWVNRDNRDASGSGISKKLMRARPCRVY